MKQIDLTITGGSKALKKMIEHAVMVSKRVLMPRMGGLEIEVTLDKNLEWHGLCGMISTKEMTIELRKTDDYVEMIKTIIHEMVHVKQYARKELKQVTPDFYVWKNELVKADIGYENYPWEHEAYELEKLIYKELYEL